jgi:hypothetical protein
MDETPTTETLNQPAGEATSTATSSVETPTTSPESPAAATTAGTEPETPAVVAPAEGDPGEHQPERPAQRRIRELVSENKRLSEEAANRLAQTPTTPQGATQKLSEMLAGKDEIDPAELDKLGEQLAAQAKGADSSTEVRNLRFEMRQEKAVNQFEADQGKVETTYPELNPDSAEYNPVLERAVAETWKKLAVSDMGGIKVINPDIRLTDVAATFDEAIKSAVERRAPGSSNQAENLSITPNPTPVREEVPFEKLTTAQMKENLKAKGYRV